MLIADIVNGMNACEFVGDLGGNVLRGGQEKINFWSYEVVGATAM